MINDTLRFISGELNSYFKGRLEINEDKVIVSNLLNHDGTVPVQILDKLVITLVNIEQETTLFNQGSFERRTSPGAYVKKNPPVYLNLYVLLAAYFNNYDESLKFISGAISYVQGNHVFARRDYPALGNDIDKLTLEIVNSDYQNINYLWGSIGARYVPSMTYKLRMLIVDNGAEQAIPVIKTTNENVTPQ